MVKPAARAALPHQPTREALELQKALEDARREAAVQGVERLVDFTRAADAAAADTSDNVVHNALEGLLVGRMALVADGTAAANSGNFATIIVYSFDPRASPLRNTTLGSLTTKEVGFTKGLPRELAIDNSLVPPGHTVGLQVTKTLSGVQLPQLRLLLEATEGNR